MFTISHHDHGCGCGHNHEHGHCHNHDHSHCHDHHHEEGHCCGHCHQESTEELVALMKYMVGHNASHARELAELAGKLEKTGNTVAYQQVMAAVSDFEKGNMRLSVVLASLEQK